MIIHQLCASGIACFGWQRQVRLCQLNDLMMSTCLLYSQQHEIRRKCRGSFLPERSPRLLSKRPPPVIAKFGRCSAKGFVCGSWSHWMCSRIVQSPAGVTSRNRKPKREINSCNGTALRQLWPSSFSSIRPGRYRDVFSKIL